MTLLDSSSTSLKPSYQLSAGLGPNSIQIQSALEGLLNSNAAPQSALYLPISLQGQASGASVPRSASTKPLELGLFNALAEFKIRTAAIAMYLDKDWRDRLFRQFDNLLDVEQWQPDDEVPKSQSFNTFLRLMLFLQPKKRPGLGATHDGFLVAAWTNGPDQLTIDCRPNDRVRWNLICQLDHEIARAAGDTHLASLPAVLEPYGPSRWFNA